MEELQRLRDSISAILLRGKLSKDPLLLRQRDGFLSSNPAGRNTLGTFAERVLPASSAANLFFLSYSGKTDPHGFFIGRDKYGSNAVSYTHLWRVAAFICVNWKTKVIS